MDKFENKLFFGTIFFLAGMIVMYLWLYSNGAIIPV